jgi:hypothetical protein
LSTLAVYKTYDLTPAILNNTIPFYLIPVLDTAAGVWCDTKSVVTTPRTGRYSADAAGGDAAVELTRRCRHAAAAVGDLIFIYGGLRGGKLIIVHRNMHFSYSSRSNKMIHPSCDTLLETIAELTNVFFHTLVIWYSRMTIL